MNTATTKNEEATTKKEEDTAPFQRPRPKAAGMNENKKQQQFKLGQPNNWTTSPIGPNTPKHQIWALTLEGEMSLDVMLIQKNFLLKDYVVRIGRISTSGINIQPLANLQKFKDKIKAA
ncbi:Uncharacterized protein Fot_11373 [Forsythia ovata]|uniref:Uncharacterized protein n=1 Tax=Forsythia ovata TaxID=205694 RepID=A0ABD1WME4_9LAMI